MATVPLPLVQELMAYGCHQEALPLLDEHLRQDAASVQVLRLMADCLRKVGRRDEAIEAYQLCSLLDPDPYDVLVGLADLLRQEERLMEGMEAAQAAIALDSERVAAQASRALLLTSLERHPEAAAAADAALRLDPEDGKARYALARAQAYLGEITAAEAAYSRVIEACPAWPLPRMERGLLRFMLGRFGEGAEDYEHRWRLEEPPPRLALDCSPWEGDPRAGTVLLWGEQGLGDEIFHLGLVPQLLEWQPNLAMVVDPRLVALVGRSFPDVLVLPRGPEPPRLSTLERALPFGSLPGLLARRGVDLPFGFAPYLRVPPAVRMPPTSTAAQGRTFRIGLFWRSFRPKLGAAKSLDPALLAPLAAIAGVELVSLQYAEEPPAVAGVPIKAPGIDTFQEIDALAGVIQGCDAIVAIPGVAAHLAGALGVPCFVLSRSRRGRVWYWESDGPRSPWYPSTRLFLCDHGEGPAVVVEQLCEEVSHLAEERRSSPTAPP